MMPESKDSGKEWKKSKKKNRRCFFMRAFTFKTTDIQCIYISVEISKNTTVGWRKAAQNGSKKVSSEVEIGF